MKSFFRFMDWPLRAKMAALLVLASLLPLVIAMIMDIRGARERLLANTSALLSAQGDRLSDQLDAFHRGYLHTVDQCSHLPGFVEFFQASSERVVQLSAGVRSIMEVFPVSDANIRGVALLDLSGTVKLATEDRLVGQNLSNRGFVRDALSGTEGVVSDIYFDDRTADTMPTIAYLSTVKGQDRKAVGLAVFWVKAAGLWNVMKASNERAGPDSFAVLFDRHGIRIGHTYSDEIVFHPGGRLDPATLDAMVAERRFGEKTRALLEDVRAFPEQFERARAKSPDAGFFRGFAPVNQKWNYGVGRRFATVPWTVFYMIPEESFNAQIAQMTQQKTLFAIAIVVFALLTGAWFVGVILKPIELLSKATEAIASGNFSAPFSATRSDELGRLGANFNVMSERLESQAKALQSARDDLEMRVRARTAELQQTAQELETENAERKRAERAGRESRQLLEAIIDNSAAVVYVKDLLGRYLLVNRRYEEIFHLTRDAILGKTDHELFPKEAADAFRKVDQRVAAGGVALTEEEVAPHHDGPHTYVSVKSPLRNTDGATYGVFGISTDITERKQAETKIQAQLNKLDLLNRITRAIAERQDLQSIFQVVIRSVEESLPVDFSCVCLYEPSAKIITVTSIGVRSAALAMDLAMTEHADIDIDENGLSRCVRGELVYEPDVSQIKFPFPQRLARGGLRALVAAPLLVESKVFGLLLAARREPDSFSSVECEFLRQVSEHVALALHQMNLYEALQKAYDDLRQTQQAVMQQDRLRALGEMASGIAHDINNAISPVSLYTESLLEKESNLSARGREYLQTIQHCVEDVEQTVGRMREFYRQREPQLTLTPVNLNRVIDQVADLTRARWSDMPQKRGIVIDLRRDLAENLPTVMAVESEIREALVNLVFNAVDAMPEGGTLTLRTRQIDGSSADDRQPLVEVQVVDTGIGMSEDTRRRCLEPFFTTKGERGTGLGLAMVYGTVKRHSADLEIESVLGRGTTISLRFALPPPDILESTPASIHEPRPSGRLRLLVVDDDPLVVKSMCSTLEIDGHEVVAALGGEEGIATFRAALQTDKPFAAVITDLGMPYVDGRQVATAIKTASATTPVILLTGWGQRLLVEGDVPSHVDRVLNKPPRLRELRAALASVTALSPSQPH